MMIAFPRRYGTAARFYDVMSLESVLYRHGRAEAVQRLRLQPGDRVLDLGCGTGLSFHLLSAAVCATGQVVGVDTSADMLVQAENRAAENDWSNVTTLRGDAGHLRNLLDGPVDAALFAYSLAVIDDWRAAWTQAVALLQLGGRVAVVDTALPQGQWRALAPLARAAQLAGGVKRQREFWSLVATNMTDATHLTLRGGHVHVAVGTVRAPLDGISQ